jgi:methylated-DNA-[protein]-cysteine S-methyltransferase
MGEKETMEMTLGYLCFPSRLGWILLASDAEAIRFIHFHGETEPDEPGIRESIERDFPGARPVRDERSPLLRAARDSILSYLADGTSIPFLPIGFGKSTSFQQEVWKALREIPSGETRSYQQIAQQIGRPRSARAVGQACGKNPIPILVPCHRVIATGGKLGGYSGGLHIKKALLAIERKDSHTP